MPFSAVIVPLLAHSSAWQDASQTSATTPEKASGKPMLERSFSMSSPPDRGKSPLLTPAEVDRSSSKRRLSTAQFTTMAKDFGELKMKRYAIRECGSVF